MPTHANVTDAAASRTVMTTPAGAAVVHLDLDGARHIFRLHGWRYDAGDDPLFESGMRHALDAFAEAGITATLFVIAEDLADAAKRRLIETAVQRGHEIASHSLTHRPLAGLPRAEKEREIFESRALLASSLGARVDGFRAPDFSLDAEALALVADAGYAYDTSLIAGARNPAATGLRTAPAGAHRPLAPRPLLELPLPQHAPLPVPFHPSYSLVLGEWYFRLGRTRTPAAAGPFVLLFHLTDFADPLPDTRLSGIAQRLYTLSYRNGSAKRAACRRMLTQVRDAFTLSSTGAIVAALRADNGANPQS